MTTTEANLTAGTQEMIDLLKEQLMQVQDQQFNLRSAVRSHEPRSNILIHSLNSDEQVRQALSTLDVIEKHIKDQEGDDA